MTSPSQPITLHELRFDLGDYWVPLGLFETEAAAKAAWEAIAKQLNRDYRTDYNVELVTLYRELPDSDAVSTMVGVIGDNNEDATMLYEDDDEEADEEPESPVAPGQVNLPL